MAYTNTAITNQQLHRERMVASLGLSFAVYAAEDGSESPKLSLQGATANVFQARRLALDIHEQGERAYVRNTTGSDERHWFLDLPSNIAEFARRASA